MNFLDLFAGIGGFRLGMERAGHKCVGYCEIDKYARLSYNAIHNTEGEIDYKDITEVTNEEFNTDGEINQVGNIGKSDNFGGNPQVTRVYDINGISPTFNTMQGGGREPKIVVPVLTPDRVEKRQNGRRFKTNGEPMFTITTQDRHGVLVKEATKQGYAVADVGDSINFSHPNSKNRRGRVRKNIANTLLTSDEQGVVLSDYKIRKLTPRECWRLQGFPRLGV